MTDIIVLAAGGLLSGVLAGFLGIGGGVLLVPLLVQLGFEPIQAAATSSLAIVVTASTGSLQNWRMGYLSPTRVVGLAIPAICTAFVGAWLGHLLPDYVLLAAFGTLLLSNLYLFKLRKQAIVKQQLANLSLSSASSSPDLSDDSPTSPSPTASPADAMNPMVARVITGGLAGFMAGLFGVGGGVIMVPLQLLLLNETIKTAVRTSLGVIVITSISACLSHALNGNVMVYSGLTLGFGGLIGVQVSTRFLPRLPDQTINLLFRVMLCVLSVYIFWQAWQSYNLGL